MERPGPQAVPGALALSERLLADGTAPALVVHRVAPAAITVGRAQRRDVDGAAAFAEGLEVVVRPSGGGPVLWDDDLIAVDVVLPTGHPLLPVDVVQAYRWVGEAVADALRGLGVGDARAVPPDEARARTPGASAGMCFGGLSPWEVISGDRKMIGLSQVRRTAGAIIQVGLPMRIDAARLARAVGAPPDAAADLIARTAPLGEIIDASLRDAAEEAVLQGLLAAAGRGGAGPGGGVPEHAP